jgi:uncharacterized membrane protein (UPF0127 family)
MSNLMRFSLIILALFGLFAATALSTIDSFSEAAVPPVQHVHVTPSPHLKETPLQIGSHTYTLEVAQSFKESELGLMGRTSLPAGHGMLFTFFPPEPARFWMRHTLIPLDMLFIADSTVIHVQEAAPPCPEKLGNKCPSYGANALLDYVVELPAHTARRDGIKPGTRIGKQP